MTEITDAEHGAQVRERLEAWTSHGPLQVSRFFWKRVPEQFWLSVDDGAGTLALLDDSDKTDAQTTHARADLIAHAPTDLARLLNRAERAENEVARLKRYLDADEDDSSLVERLKDRAERAERELTYWQQVSEDRLATALADKKDEEL